MSEAALVATDLQVGYRASRHQARPVLSGLSVALASGEFACLLGPNGCGKSTLLRSLAGSQAPLAGSISLSGDNIRSLSSRDIARRLSVVTTDRLDTGIMPVYDLVGLGRYPHTGWSGRMSDHDHAVVRWALSATQSEGLTLRNIGELSDGERQRVAVARALAQEPQVMLLDEPTAFLDVPRKIDLIALLRRLTRESGLAVLMSTHDIDLALRMADTIWLVDPEGAFVVGAPEDLALDGNLERVFGGPNLVFDSNSGGFRFRHVHRGTYHMRADGPSRYWTIRALERAGYEPALPADDPDAALFDIECAGPPARRSWLLRRGASVIEVTTLGALIRVLHSAEESPEAASSAPSLGAANERSAR